MAADRLPDPAEQNVTEGMPPELVRALRDPTIRLPQDDYKLADGRSLWDHLQEWRNAPSDTASGGPVSAAVSPAEPPEGNRVTDPLGDAITVLSNVKIEDPSARIDTEDAEMRVQLALSYLEMIGSHRALALVEYARQRSTRDDVVEALDELEGLVKPRGR